MPRLPRGDKKPRHNRLIIEVGFGDFVDGGSTVGTYTSPDQIPAGAVVGHPISVQVITPFTGDVSAALTVGDGTDVDRYNTSTIDAFAAAGHRDAGLVSGAKGHSAAVNVVLTITTNADFTSVAAGKLRVVVPYYEP